MIDKTYLYQSLLKLFCFLISLLVPAALLLGGLTRSISPAYPHQVYKFLPADELGLTQTERLDLALITLAYLQHPEPAATAVRFLESQRLPGTNQPLYNERELAHLVDVKQLTDRIAGWSETLNWLLGLSLLALVAWPATRFAAVKAFQRGAAFSFFLLLACFMFIPLFWPLFFFGFHHWLFPPGSWSFAGADTLIRLFPEAFWFNYAQQVFAEQVVYAVLLLLATSILVVIMGTKAAPTGPSPDQIAEPWVQSPLPIEPIARYSDLEAYGRPATDPENPDDPDPFAQWPFEE
ncbi:MAG: DUF1461 domain-containing protein [Chloroflexi bacterium]|nr:DUF1461 domain-containing protein [Chloroflexota bacterium]